MANYLESFRSAMKSSGLDYTGDILPDGKVHRINCEGERGESSWYIAFQSENFVAGTFGDWRRDLNVTWNSSKVNGSNLSREDWNRLNQKMREAENARKTEDQRLHAQAKTWATQILSAASQDTESHLYLLQKSVGAYGEMRVCLSDFKVSPSWTMPVAGCLVLPLRDINGVLQTVEFISPDKRFGKDGKKRNKQLLFGGDPKGTFYVISDRTDGPLIICEGYATGATLYESTSYATVCTRNAGNILPVAEAFRKKYPKRDIIIASDNDRFVTNPATGEPKNPGIEAATKAAAAIRAAIAIPDFSDSDLASSDFNDLAEVSGNAGKTIVKQTIEAAYKDFLTPKFKELPTVDNAADLWTDETIIEPPQIINGLLHQGLKCVIGSSSKAYKSWILLDIAVSVVTGKPFWMFGTRKGKVLYLNFEIPRWSIKSRIREMARKKDVDEADLRNLDVWSLRGYGTELFKLLPDMLRQIEYGGYSLVILDPIYKVLGGRDENAAGDVALMCNELEMICVKTGAAVLYAAHFSKGNQAEKEAMDRIGGSGVFGRDPDTIITLTKNEQEGAYTVDVILRNLKQVDPFVMKLDFPVYVQATDADPEALKKSGQKQPEYKPDEIRDLLGTSQFSMKAWQRMAYDELGVSRAQFFRIVRRLEDSGLVSKDAVSGDWRQQTPRTPPRQPSEGEQAIMREIDRAQQPEQVDDSAQDS